MDNFSTPDGSSTYVPGPPDPPSNEPNFSVQPPEQNFTPDTGDPGLTPWPEPIDTTPPEIGPDLGGVPVPDHEPEFENPFHNEEPIEPNEFEPPFEPPPPIEPPVIP
jgi:hypothetical protein